jgi:WXG100 family type VII secretion target
MNVDAVRNVARSLKVQAASLRAVLSRVDAVVNSIQNDWKGSDAQAFCSWWRNEHRPKLVDLITKLDGLGQTAANNADEQERVSNGSSQGGGHHGSSGGGGGGGGGWGDEPPESGGGGGGGGSWGDDLPPISPVDPFNPSHPDPGMPGRIDFPGEFHHGTPVDPVAPLPGFTIDPDHPLRAL